MALVLAPLLVLALLYAGFRNLLDQARDAVTAPLDAPAAKVEPR
jgi:hypothetical protein